jgi:endonuclease YncB( thermonuclease family)
MRSLLFLFVVFSLFSPADIQAQEIATVIRIIDGDPLKTNCNGQEESVRLIGRYPREQGQQEGKRRLCKNRQKSRTYPLAGQRCYWLC